MPKGKNTIVTSVSLPIGLLKELKARKEAGHGSVSKQISSMVASSLAMMALSDPDEFGRVAEAAGVERLETDDSEPCGGCSGTDCLNGSAVSRLLARAEAEGSDDVDE